MIKRIRAIVEGRVQMVMFRDFTSRYANKHAITGTVRNLPDGAVEVIAEADEQMLNALIGELQKGPLLAKVQHVIVDWSDAKNCYTDFQIAYE